MATDTLPPTAGAAPGVTPPPPLPGKAKPTTPATGAAGPGAVKPDGTNPDAPDVDASPDAGLEEGLVGKKRPFLQTPWVQDVLPLATSIILHAGIIGFGFASYKAYVAIKAVVEEQVLVPDSNIVEGAEVGGIPNPGLGGDPTMSSAQDDVKDVTPQDQNWNTKPSESLAASLAGAQGETTDNTIGLGPNSAFGSAKGDGVGSGGEAGGSLAPFGVPGGGGGLGPKNPLFGQTGNIKKIVYICDATGTMLGLKFELLKQQLAAAVDNLKPIQDYNVIFFRGGSTDNEWALPMEKNRMVKATPANKQKSFKFVNEMSVLGNGTNPLPALQQAFAMQPQLIIFLTDGEFNNFSSYADVLAEVDRLNPDRKVRINTILMMGEDDKAEETLREMSNRNGGNFRKVEENDLR